MDVALHLPKIASSGFLPTGSLLESLIHLTNEVASMENLPFVQVRNTSTMIRRIKLLSSLFEEIQEDSDSPLPPSSILCLTELFSVIRRAKLLIQACREGSSLWGLIQIEVVSNQFHVLVKEMGSALDILPLSLLNVTPDIREQVELLHKQAKRVDLFVDPKEIRRREELVQVMALNSEKKSRNKSFVDVEKVKMVFSSIGLRTALDYEEEITKLEAEAMKQAGTGGLIVVSNINNLISLVSYSKSSVFTDEEAARTREENRLQPSSFASQTLDPSSSFLTIPNVPDEFRCPISLDLMRDPVIVASGHTYDRNSIAEWINSGHHTCPKSGQRLIHMALVPNYALRSLVHQWCQENNVPLKEDKSPPSSSSSSSSSSFLSSASSRLQRTSSRTQREEVVDHISATKTAMDSVKRTAEFLVGKLAMGSPVIQRQAAYELRLLAKTGMDNRRIIAEAGAIPFLVTLLTSHDARIQENAVTALLNLSILENNKMLIMAAGSIDSIIQVVESGKTMVARENAAATIFSLTMINDHKAVIGARSRVIPALVTLLKEATTAGKKDAAIALFNLALHSANKVSIVKAGAVPLLIELLMDDKAGITDDALGVLALVLGCDEGLESIKNSRAFVPLLIDLLRYGSSKGKENSITILLGLCKDGGEDIPRRLLMNPRSIPSLQSLAAQGSLKAQRKAEALMRLLNRCCSQSHSVA